MTSYLRHHGMLTCQSSRSGGHEDLLRRMPKISDETVTYTLSTRGIVLIRTILATSYLNRFHPPGYHRHLVKSFRAKEWLHHDLPLKSVAFLIPSLHYSLPGTHPHPRRRPIDPPIPLITPSASLPPTPLRPRHFCSKIETEFTFTFFLITLSNRLWDRTTQELGTMRQNVLDMKLRNEMFEQKLLKLLRDYGTPNEMTWKGSYSVPYLKKTQEDTARPLDKACVPPFR